MDNVNCIAALHQSIINNADPDAALWEALLECQNEQLYTSSGLPFEYTIRRRKNGEYSGELLVSRKEGSKTLTRSSVLLAFHRVLEEIQITETGIIPPFFKGPKAIGQIFGISYIYSLFYYFGLISVPEKYKRNLQRKSYANPEKTLDI